MTPHYYHHHYHPLTHILLFLLLPLSVRGVSSLTLEDYYISNTCINDVKFTTHIVNRLHPVRSLLDCLRQCAADRDRCKAVTFAPGSPAICQGHSKVMAAGDNSVALPRAKTFAFGPVPPTPRRIPDWVSSACESSADCVDLIPDSGLYQSTQLPICYKKLCLCIPGLFYSISQKLCVSSCANNQLQSTYRLYPRSSLKTHNDYIWLFKSVSNCKIECNALTDCENFERSDVFFPICNAARVSVGPPDFFSNEDWNYYQRDCA
ncbi:hypothetical protein ACOMHN_055517 [Nucella lapillus]